MNASVKDATGAKPADAGSDSPPFRFYDNRQKYLAFVNTCNEKSAVARRAAHGAARSCGRRPPAIRCSTRAWAMAPCCRASCAARTVISPRCRWSSVAKEISLEDVRLGLDKMPDRFSEHPATVLVITNLNYTDAPRLMPRDVAAGRDPQLAGSAAQGQLGP